MAQLIKLYDYIWRYEWNMYRYPSQYIRLKKDKWKDLHNDWIDRELKVGHQEGRDPDEKAFPVGE